MIANVIKRTGVILIFARWAFFQWESKSSELYVCSCVITEYNVTSYFPAHWTQTVSCLLWYPDAIQRDTASVRYFCSQILSYFTPWSVEYYSSSKVFLSTMSFQAFSRVARAFSFGGSRQFLGRRLGERSSHIRQEKRPATKDEMGMLVLGLGLFTAASVWVRKKTIFKLNFGRIFYARIQRLKVKGKADLYLCPKWNFYSEKHLAC